MAQKKFATLEEAAAAMGVELTDQIKPFLNTFVIKEKKEKVEGEETTSNRKKELLEKAELYSVPIADKAKETVDSLKIRITQHLYSEGKTEELEEFCAANKLAVDEDGKLYRVKAAIKSIEDRVAGDKAGTVGNLTILMLQSEEYADMSMPELAAEFPAFCEAQGYPEQGAKGTTPASITWYVNYCRKHFIQIVERKHAKKATGKTKTGKQLGAEMTLEKALTPRGFAKKKAEAGSVDLED
jgi:hypothetical protein